MKVALVCIAKNEDNYIQEWCDYHLKLGFDHIFIYENNWRCNLNSDKITKIPFDGQVMQVPSYNHFIQNYSDKYEWAAFFDVDEFLVLKKHSNVKEFINDYKEYNAIGVNWYFFGSNNQSFVEGEYSLLKRFTKRSSKINEHIKTILKLNKNTLMGVHNPNIQIVDTNYNLFSGPFNPNGDDNIAQLNHYFSKTKEEFNLKRSRGRADANIIRCITDFEKHNDNETDDFHALNFMYNQ